MDAAPSLPFVRASQGSEMAFVAIVAAVIVAFLIAVFRAYQKTEPQQALWKTLFVALLTGVWLGLVMGAVATGAMERLPLRGLPVFFAAVLLVSIAAALSPVGRRIAGTVSLGALVAFQAFRLPLELVLHAWSDMGTIPSTMTWTGQNWDIVTGIVAVLAAPFASKRRGVAWGANLVGFVLLLNVVRVVAMSSPLPFAWNVQPPLVLALHLPYALIAPVCVGGALAGHLVLTRALLRRDGSAK